MSINDFFQLFLLWVLLGASVVLVWTALRARRTEQEEGLPPANLRVIATLSVFGLVRVLVLLATLSTFSPAPEVGSFRPAQSRRSPPRPHSEGRPGRGG